MTLLWRSDLSTSITELLLLPKFNNSSPSVTRDKEICHLRRSKQWNPFNVYLLSKFDVSSFFLTGYIDFQIGYFADSEQFRVDVQFSNFGQVKTDPICSLLLTLDRSQLFHWVLVRHTTKNNPKPPSLLRIHEPSVGSVTFQTIFNDSISGNQELVSSVNK